jgi:apolipoprotein D and lipocalin family protein
MTNESDSMPHLLSHSRPSWRHCIAALLVWVALSGLPVHPVWAAAPETVSHIDLKRYAGTWYEAARFPMFFQRKCARDVTALYSLSADGTVNVDNRCVQANGSTLQATGQATAVDPSNSQLEVTFLPEMLRWLPVGRGDYWILKIDSQYQTVLVGSPDREYLWILSRQPQINEKTYLDYVEAARRQGYNISRLQRTTQTAR